MTPAGVTVHHHTPATHQHHVTDCAHHRDYHRSSVCATCDGRGWVMTPDTVGRAFAAVMEHGRGAGVPHLRCPDCRSEVAATPSDQVTP